MAEHHRKLKNLPPGTRPITNVGIAKTRFTDDFTTSGARGSFRGQFYELVKKIGIRLELPKNDAPYVVLSQPITGTYNTGTKFTIHRFSLFTNTSKMPGPSFATPAGPPAFGGTCMAAALGEDVQAARGSLEERTGISLRRSLPVLQGIDDAEPTRGLTKGVQRSYNGDPSFTCRSCLTADARVLVRGRGLVPIGDLADADEFQVWSGKAWRWTTAVLQGVRPVVELRTNWGQVLRLTSDHRVLTEDGMMEVADLEPGQRLVHEPPIESHPMPAASPLMVRHRGSGHHASADESFPSAWTYDVGAVLGCLLGDGSITGGKYPTVSILEGEEDRDIVDALHGIVSGWCKTASAPITKTPRVAAADALVHPKEPKPQVRIEWRVRALVEFLSDLGLDKRAPIDERRAPTSIWTATAEGVRGFLAGLFGTDGSVTVSGAKAKIEVSLASVSEGLLRDVQLLLFSVFGIRSSICPYATSNEQRSVLGYKPLFKLGINAIEHVRRFGSDVCFFSRRKQARLAEALSLPPNVERAGRNSLPTVESIVALPKDEPVYDLVNVGDEHQFVANGISVSNCYALGGNYVYPSKQIADMMHLAWIEYELAQGGPARLGTALAYAIQHMNMVRKEGFQPYFRIHDAGDFHSEAYLEAWVHCASMMTHMRFWAPTRQWIFARWVPLLVSATKRVRDAGGWLVIRPSVLRFYEAVPEIPGLAAGSGVSSEKAEPCVWSCPVYNKIVPRPQPDGTTRMEEAVSCLEANCLTCWDNPEIPVSYGAH